MSNEVVDRYAHIDRKKTVCELLRLSTAVMGVDFAYSAETSFVSPLLLELGLQHGVVAAVWAIPPVLGLIVGPLFGIMSDRCTLPMGRRRPFVLALAALLTIGILLVSFGRDIGRLLGDIEVSPIRAITLITIGTVLMDFNADLCQGPTRAYLLEVSKPGDHDRGLRMFTTLSGIGGFMGYLLGAVNWNIFLPQDVSMSSNIKFVYLTVGCIIVVSVILTVTSFKEIPLKAEKQENKVSNNESACDENEHLTLKKLIKSTIFMPKQLFILYLTTLLMWMSHLSYVLYFTDFVGEAVLGGDPGAESGSAEAQLYEEGVRLGCLGLAINSLSCSISSLIVGKMVKLYKAKYIYVSGLVVCAVGMCALASLKTTTAVLTLSFTAGIGLSILSNMPYIVLAQFHTEESVLKGITKQKRGLGTDIAVISSTVFVAQIILSIILGLVSTMISDTALTVWCSGILSLLAGLMASFVSYQEERIV